MAFMVAQVAITDAYGKPSPYALILDREGDTVRIRLDGGFAGREIDEEIALDELQKLAGTMAYAHHDILGLILESDGTEVKGLIGVGSGNERFVVKSSELSAAVAQL